MDPWSLPFRYSLPRGAFVLSLMFSTVNATWVHLSRANGALATCTIGRFSNGMSPHALLSGFQMGNSGRIA